MGKRKSGPLQSPFKRRNAGGQALAGGRRSRWGGHSHCSAPPLPRSRQQSSPIDRDVILCCPLPSPLPSPNQRPTSSSACSDFATKSEHALEEVGRLLGEGRGEGAGLDLSQSVLREPFVGIPLHNIVIDYFLINYVHLSGNVAEWRAVLLRAGGRSRPLVREKAGDYGDGA